MADYRSYRDTASKAFMESIGFDARRDAVYPDIAFSLPAPTSTREQGADHAPLTVGVGVMAYHGWLKQNTSARVYNEYLAKLTDFVLWLLDRGHLVRVLIGDLIDRSAVEDLVTNVRKARPELPPDRLLACPSDSLQGLMQEMAATDVVVATRFHNIICALKAGKPVVSIGYGEKNAVLLVEMGLQGFCQRIDGLQCDLLIEQFTRLVANRQRYAQSIRAATLALRERLDQQGSLLAARLL